MCVRVFQLAKRDKKKYNAKENKRTKTKDFRFEIIQMRMEVSVFNSHDGASVVNSLKNGVISIVIF